MIPVPHDIPREWKRAIIGYIKSRLGPKGYLNKTFPQAPTWRTHENWNEKAAWRMTILWGSGEISLYGYGRIWKDSRDITYSLYTGLDSAIDLFLQKCPTNEVVHVTNT
jgi:hypothetical protein